MFLRDLAAAISDLVLPTACAGCARPGDRLCPRCGAAVVVRHDIAGVPTYVAADYAAGIRAALVAYKERDRRELAAPLGRLLTVAVGAVAEGGAAIVLVPVPSSRAAVRRRGGDHVARLAHRCGRLLGVPVSEALSLNRAVLDAARLSADARAVNMSGAMSATGPPAVRSGVGRPREAVIVDDIVTTGATVGEAARALTDAGWQVRAAAAIARTRLRRPPLSSGRSPSGTTYPTRLPWG